jgi:hypothetical protein
MAIPSGDESDVPMILTSGRGGGVTATLTFDRQQVDEYQRLSKLYGVQWTPTILVLDASGEERHRIEGFLPVEDFLPQLAFGLAHAAFARGGAVAFRKVSLGRDPAPRRRRARAGLP